MKNIILICTIHGELGKCNSNELYEIIKIIKPEVIFDEIPSSRYNIHFVEQSVSTLETEAIKMYLENHNAKIIPVDNYENFDIQKEDLDYNKISNRNIEYYNLCKEQYLLMIQYGFEYINSIQHNQLIEKLQIIEKEVLKNINDEKLLRVFKMWYEITEKRENEILNNIYTYCKEHTFDIGLMLIGAEHRNSIINKIKNIETNNELKINWNFNFFNS
jgi:hypothetical protein